MERITSRQNALVARFREAARRAGPSVLLEGTTLIDDALAAGVRVEIAAIRMNDRGRPAPADEATVRRLTQTGARIVGVTRPVLDALSPVKTPSGLVALAARPAAAPDRLLLPAPALILILMDVQDPGNVGAVVRAADAAGATGVVTTAGCADAFGWKALRGSMGSAFRLPLWTGPRWPEVAAFLRTHGVRTVATAPRAAPTVFDQKWEAPTAFLLGAEGSGLAPDVAAQADVTVSVPMRDGVDSLNVAVTAALIAYEVRRARTPAPAGPGSR